MLLLYMAVNCQRCGTQVGATEWFCSFCGKERPMCPDCGAEMDEEQCKNCGTPRQAPCGNCGLMIAGTAEECPNCNHRPSDDVAEKSSGRKKKALAFGGVGILGYFIVSSIVPGPSIIGSAAGVLVAIPFISWGGMLAFYYNRKESKAEHLTAADLSKGREQNKTKEWRDMEREQRKQMLQAGAKVAGAAGEAASSYAEKKKKDQENEQLKEQLNETAEYAQSVEQENKELKESPDLPSQCPKCGADWTGGLLSSPNVEEFDNGNKASCTECRNTEYLFS